jgi:hypothetical protein
MNTSNILALHIQMVTAGPKTTRLLHLSRTRNITMNDVSAASIPFFAAKSPVLTRTVIAEDTKVFCNLRVLNLVYKCL